MHSDIYRNFKLLEVSKELRKNMTRHEKKLWYDYLSKYPIRWYKQRIIDNFVVDFFCYKAMLAIELDGIQHNTEEAMAYDAERTQTLERYGIKVLRFSNFDVDINFEMVCLEIDKTVRERLS